MKIGLLGKGKTGARVIDLVKDHSQHELFVFDRSHPITAQALEPLDGVISFLPGDAFVEYLPILFESKKIVVSGSTGFTWPENFLSKLHEQSLTWLHATNFALGMGLVRLMIEDLSLAKKLFENPQFSLHEIHHTKKLDAPSGTALSFRQWAGGGFDITSERIGDIIGIHTLKMQTQSESITLTHEALDRKIFAQGALWALEKLAGLEGEKRPVGLIDLHQLIRYHFQLPPL